MPRRRLLLAILALVFVGGCDSPDEIVDDAVAAARTGDRAAYAACFTERSRPILASFWAAADEANPKLGVLSVLGDPTVIRVQPARRLHGGPERAVVVVEEAGRRARLVVHELAGTWRIDLVDTEREMSGMDRF